MDSRVLAMMCLLWIVCSVGTVTAEESAEPVGWEVLPNGLIEVRYDQSGDGVPDHFTLHQITWAGWTAQEIREIEAQARVDAQWVFIVEYDHDQYVYLTKAVPLFVADDPRQDGRWTAVPVESYEDFEGCRPSCLVCARCKGYVARDDP